MKVVKVDSRQEESGVNATPTLGERVALGPRLSIESRLIRALEHLTVLQMELYEHDEELCEILDLEELEEKDLDRIKKDYHEMAKKARSKGA